MYVFCPRKVLVDIHPKILGAGCVFYFRVINFYFKITRLTSNDFFCTGAIEDKRFGNGFHKCSERCIGGTNPINHGYSNGRKIFIKCITYTYWTTCLCAIICPQTIGRLLLKCRTQFIVFHVFLESLLYFWNGSNQYCCLVIFRSRVSVLVYFLYYAISFASLHL